MSTGRVGSASRRLSSLKYVIRQSRIWPLRIQLEHIALEEVVVWSSEIIWSCEL